MSPVGFGHLSRLKDVGRGAAGGKGPEDVVFFDKGFDLTAEDLFEAVVVADGGEDGGIGGKSDGGQAFAMAAEASDQLGGNVLGIGRGAAVAAQVDAAAVPKTAKKHVSGLFKRFGAFLFKRRQTLFVKGDGLIPGFGKIDFVHFVLHFP